MERRFHISGKVTFEEYLECHKVMAAKRRWWIRGFILAYGIGVLVFQQFRWPDAGWNMLSAVGVLAITYAIGISPILFHHRVKRNWHRYPKIREDMEVTFDTEGFTAKDDRDCDIFTSWGKIISWRETPNLFMLYFSPILPLVVPKRLIAGDEIDGFRDLLAEVIPNIDKR